MPICSKCFITLLLIQVSLKNINKNNIYEKQDKETAITSCRLSISCGCGNNLLTCEISISSCSIASPFQPGYLNICSYAIFYYFFFAYLLGQAVLADLSSPVHYFGCPALKKENNSESHVTCTTVFVVSFYVSRILRYYN